MQKSTVIGFNLSSNRLYRVSSNLGSVSSDDLNAAIAWCKVLKTHMIKAYSAVTYSSNIKASYLSEKILNLIRNGTDKTDKTDWLTHGFTAHQLRLERLN